MCKLSCASSQAFSVPKAPFDLACANFLALRIILLPACSNGTPRDLGVIAKQHIKLHGS